MEKDLKYHRDILRKILLKYFWILGILIVCIIGISLLGNTSKIIQMIIAIPTLILLFAIIFYKLVMIFRIRFVLSKMNRDAKLYQMAAWFIPFGEIAISQIVIEKADEYLKENYTGKP